MSLLHLQALAPHRRAARSLRRTLHYRYPDFRLLAINMRYGPLVARKQGVMIDCSFVAYLSMTAARIGLSAKLVGCSSRATPFPVSRTF
jgi:hypothetical protein